MALQRSVGAFTGNVGSAYAVLSSTTRNTVSEAVGKVAAADPKQIVRDTATWMNEHRAETALYGVCGVCGLSVAAPALIAGPTLGIAGFGSGGVVGGSMAAAAQPAAVGAGTLFATLQSAGAGGYGVPIVYGAVQGGMATVGTAAGISTWWRKKRATGESGHSEPQPEELQQETSKEVTTLSEDEQNDSHEEAQTVEGGTKVDGKVGLSKL